MIKKIRNKFKIEYHKLVDFQLPKYFHKSKFLSGLYYAFFSSAFKREHNAILAGKAKYLEDEGKFYLLIRNTHRLEKGLLMKPRKKIFAERYIEETVEVFEKILNDEHYEMDDQIIWSQNVLSEYFKIVEKNDKLKRLYERFLDVLSTKPEITFKSKIPYKRLSENFSTVTYDQFYNLTKQRRSVRWFEKKKVPRELIDKALAAANQAPSACNRQPFEYYIFDDPDMVEKLVEMPMGTTGYSHSIPVMIVVVGNTDAYYSERDRHLIYIDASLANMNFMLALETLGLSSCPINWPDVEEREILMERFLNLKPFQRPIMCIGVGYPDMEGLVAYSEKRSINKLRYYNNHG